MKTTFFLHSVRRSLILLACAGILSLPTALSAASKDREPAYNNYIDLSAGYVLQSGDRPGFQKNFQMNKDGFGGIEALLLTRQIDDSTSLTLRGRALAGNDYLFDLNIIRDEVGYLKLGYKQYRTWFDGKGGNWQPTGMMFQYRDHDLHLDRGNLWFEAGLNRPDAPSFVLRYDYLTRNGEKDSTIWGDSGLLVAGQSRGTIPTYQKIDEARHVLNGSVTKNADKYGWSAAVRYDKGDYNNARYIRRNHEQSTARWVTSREGQDFDMFQMRGSYTRDLTDMLKLTTAVAQTKTDTILQGSRIYGVTPDAAWTTDFPTRQFRDSAYFGMNFGNLGEAEMKQTVATINMLYRATENLSIVPAVRFENTDWSNRILYESTTFGAGPAFAASRTPTSGASDKDWEIYSASLEVRYTGIKNVSFNAKADWSNSEGNLTEDFLSNPGLTNQAISIARTTALERATQKYSFTTNWYVRPGTSVAAQYYYRVRLNDYRTTRDSAVSTGDRYPAFISNQDLETNNFNLRLNWLAAPNLRTVSRYDYMETLIKTQTLDLRMTESMKNTRHMLSETATWNPVSRWYLQATVNLVYDTLTTPPVKGVGAAANLVKNSDANYLTYTLGSGYALDDRSDLYVDYNSYEARDSFVNNTPTSVAYGSQAKSQVASVMWTRKLDRRTSISLKYAYAKFEEPVYGTRGDYEANLFYGKLQYRF